MNPILAMLVGAVKAYVIQLATKEVAHRVLLAIAEAVVKNTKTDLDDKSLEVVRGLLISPTKSGQSEQPKK